MKDVLAKEISKGVTLWKIPTPSSCPVFARCSPLRDLSVITDHESPLIIHLLQERALKDVKGKHPSESPKKARGKKKPTNSSKLALFQRVFHHPWKHGLFASSETIRSVSGLCEFWAPFPKRQKVGDLKGIHCADGPQPDRFFVVTFFWGGGVRT